MARNKFPSTRTRILAAKRDWRDAIKRYGRHDVVTLDYLRQLRELASCVIEGAL